MDKYLQILFSYIGLVFLILEILERRELYSILMFEFLMDTKKYSLSRIRYIETSRYIIMLILTSVPLCILIPCYQLIVIMVFSIIGLVIVKSGIRHNVILLSVITNESFECSICLEENQDNVIELICGHQFHYRCINESLNYSNRCPLCRMELENVE
jgi:hypothetical protein